MRVHHSEGGFRFISMSYHPRCEELARVFLEPDATDEQVRDLAQWLQDAAEEYLGFLE